jgi:DNA-binding GntR family transcriptional regulator
MTDENVADLAADLEAMRAAARADDGHAVAQADARFHGRIIELADNSTLERVWSTLEPFSRTYITLVVPGADPHWSADLHAPILAAIERRDTEAVVEAIERHFEEVRDNMFGRWPDGDPPAVDDLLHTKRNR